MVIRMNQGSEPAPGLAAVSTHGFYQVAMPGETECKKTEKSCHGLIEQYYHFSSPCECNSQLIDI